MSGCEFNSLQYLDDNKVIEKGGDSITKQALRATLDADVTVNKLERGNNLVPRLAEVVIDPSFVTPGIQFTGVGCVANGTVPSGSGCAVHKPGWSCSTLSCEATKWGQAKCTPDGKLGGYS